MKEKETEFLEFITIFDETSSKPTHPLYGAIIRHTLKQILPDNFFELKGQSERAHENYKKRFLAQLPLVKANFCEVAPGSISFYCLFRYRASGFKFFFDLILNWPLPGKRVDVGLVYAVDFRIPEIGEEVFTLCEVMIKVEKQEELEQIYKDFPIIESDARLGVASSFYARRILEIKGLSPDQKTAMIQEYMASLVRRASKTFDGDIFSEMQHVLVICHDDFKLQRDARHLGRIIAIHYHFRRELLDCIKRPHAKRHVLVKVFKAKVSFPAGQKSVLGVTVGLNFLRDKEVFEQRHLLKAIKHYVPNAEAIEETFFANRRGSEQLCTIYLEIEKSDNKPFSPEEIANLKYKLSNDLKNHIGRWTLPVFMPRNEEEIMRNILSLSNQIKYLRDIPQVFISFDEQSDRNLFFTIIFVRIATDETKPIQEVFKTEDTFLRYIPDRTKVVGILRKKHSKEATVFRVKFLKESFIRGDHTIDLYKARQALVNELSRLLGDFRDFNGGMIAKQNELLTEVRSHLAKEGAKYNDLLLENFFYSLAPVIMRTVLEPYAFKELFGMLVESVDKGIPFGHRYSVKVKTDSEFCFVMLAAHTRANLEDLTKSITKMHYQSSELAHGYVKTHETVCVGYIYRSTDVHKQMLFRSVFELPVEGLAVKSK